MEENEVAILAETDANRLSRSCLAGFTSFVHFLGPNTFFNVYFWTRVLGFIILPSILLIILNALLIRGIRRAQKRKLRLLRYILGSSYVSQNERKRNLVNTDFQYSKL